MKMRRICYKSSYSDLSCLNLFLFLWKKFKLGEVTNMWISHAQFLKFLVTLKENIFYKEINIYFFLQIILLKSNKNRKIKRN